MKPLQKRRPHPQIAQVLRPLQYPSHPPLFPAPGRLRLLKKAFPVFQAHITLILRYAMLQP